LPYLNLKMGNEMAPPPDNIGFGDDNSSNNSGPEIKNKPHLTFLIRKNPKSVGGVQRLNSAIINGLSNSFDVEKIIWGGPEWGVPIYFPIFYYKSTRNGSDLVHCEDAATALIGAKIRSSSGKKVVATVHGLDVILPIPWYQRKLKSALDKIDKIICVSKSTAEQVRLRGIDPKKIEVVPCPAESAVKRVERDDILYSRIETLTGFNLHGKKVLFSLGRLVRRKGYDYFITKILPHLPDDCVYIIAGPIPRSPSWIKTFGPIIGQKTRRLLYLASGCDSIHDELIRLSRQHPRVFYLNGISDELRNLLFAASDLFIMPNRTVEGDMEGFGIVALEASIRGVPVIATCIEGITDAVINGENGYCVPEGDRAGMIKIANELLSDPHRLAELGRSAIESTQRRFSLEYVAGRYKKIFNDLLAENPRKIKAIMPRAD
jgi:glycosyltransferase involved in cell wall biosynthesis